MGQLRIRLFGTPSYAWDDEPATRVAETRAAWLLAYLALAPGHRASRAELNEELWGHAGDDARVAARYVRENHPGLPLEAEGSKPTFVERLAAPDVWVDVKRLKGLCEEGKLEEALELARGRVLDGINNETELANAVAPLAGRLAVLSDRARLAAWERALHVFALGKRSRLLFAVAAMTPALPTTVAPGSVVQVIREVCEWWE